MALFTGITQNFSSYLSPQKPSELKRLLTPPDSEPARDSPVRGESLSPKSLPEGRSGKSVDVDQLLDLDGETLQGGPSTGKKRPASPEKPASRSRKRQRIGSDDAFHDPGDDDSSDFEGVTLVTSNSPSLRPKSAHKKSKQAEDRELMPPPGQPRKGDQNYVPPRHLVDKDLPHNIVRIDQEDDLSDPDEVYTTRHLINKKNRNEVTDFDEHKARRYAEAITLPANSGVWSQADQDLFFRLAMRGFEPLVPKNWALDFKTLPHTLFATDSRTTPLIQTHSQRHFRAIHALRNLFNIGMNARDRVLSLHRLRPEPVMRRMLEQYISWALSDAGLDSKQHPIGIPVHAIATLKRGKTTRSTITKITKRLYKLASRYRDFYDMRESLEPRVSSSTIRSDKSDDTSNHQNATLPVLTGLMICSSLIAVVTLDSRILPPASLNLPGTSSQPSSPSLKHSHGQIEPAKGESGLRFIATFNFSDSRMDVWNALAIAICVMRIRETMLEVRSYSEASGKGEKERSQGVLKSTVPNGGREISPDPDT